MKQEGTQQQGTPVRKYKTPAEEAESKSRVHHPKLPAALEQELQEDLRKRILLSSNTLPSICFFTFLNTYQCLNAIEMSADASMIAAGFSDSVIKLWDLKRDSHKIFPDRNGPRKASAVGDVANTTTSTAGASTANGATKKSPTDYHLLQGHFGPVYGLSFTPDHQFLFSASEDTTVRLWSTEYKKNLVAYKGHNHPVWDVSCSPLGHYFATASHDRTARLWSTDNIFPLRIFAGHLSDVDCVKFHPNCNYIATGSSDKSLRLWEVNTGECVRIFTGHFGGVNTLAISPDGRVLASGGEDKNVILWDIGSGKKIKTLQGHKKTIWSLDFSAEGSVLASGSADNTICLWDINKARSGSTLNLNLQADNPSLLKLNNNTNNKESSTSIGDMLAMFATKKTPVCSVKFTRRNLLLAAGSFQGQSG
eukprot:TRINITY_DN3335_c0_g1_i2.p1 TRINITY_DN3335_c0_g1~~TRINITY_DN3335_c0_g1_i2.p1  ORF type:complete len:422 (-),score=60.83 TRINITY_DN3335_c0_g1_i2:110-1375(-)